ncbi:unnamed protein product [Ceutorhynchus assimilis]|uniref:Odorant receptor n=1 Tax=Ceutorhynchus assimilis TaxID=467358 RepID=A0A9N9MDH3_9CUCU|nr:unnamed protein product [Ceutorhynchus assimilis]
MLKSKKTVKFHKSWRKSISATEAILKLTGVWPDKNSISRWIKIVTFTLIAGIFDISIIMELRNLLKTQDYEALSTHLSTFGLYIGYTVKTIIFQFKKKAFKEMIESIDQPLFEDYQPEMEPNKDECIRVSNGISKFYISCVAASIFLYLNKPLYTDLPLPISFSYELNTVTFILVLIMQCFSCYYLVMIGISFDMIIVGLINIATAQLDILGEAIMSFQPKNPNPLEEEEQAFLIKCARKHQAVIRFVGQIENVFTFIFLVQCLASVTSICNGAFQLTHAKELLSIQALFNFAFMFDVLFEIGTICWFAGLLTLKSVEISDACYNYNWLNSSTRTKRMLLIILLRSQRPMYVTAGTFIRLSMSSFLTVIKTAYSYFALMQSLYDKKNDA